MQMGRQANASALVTKLASRSKTADTVQSCFSSLSPAGPPAPRLQSHDLYSTPFRDFRLCWRFEDLSNLLPGPCGQRGPWDKDE